MKHSTFVRTAAVSLAVPAALVLAAGSSVAASDVVVTNTETIQAHLDASGKVKDARVYDQLALTGSGTVDVANPVSTKGLRNLDGFGGYDVKDGNIVTKVSVDGDKRLRTVSDFDKQIPLTIKVTYVLDGKEVPPTKVVGASGKLEVRYHVENVTGKNEQVSFDDGTGQQVTKDVPVVIPMVGSLTTILPSSFTDVASQQANMAGDGRGGTKMSFTMTLFGPIGSASADFGYTATITDGEVPPASISALPVSPLESPSFKGGAESYKGGAATGIELTAGATEIDSNLLKLRDGAGQLLAGLIQLRDGANQLNAGLAGQAAPGAAKLAAGAAKLQAGTGALFSGASDAKVGVGVLAAGAHKLSSGTSDLAAGAVQLDRSLADYQGGLTDLAAGIQALPENPGYKELLAGISSIQKAIGSPSEPTTLRGGLALLKSGVTGKLQPGVSALFTGISTLKSEIDASLASDVPALKGLASTAKASAVTAAVKLGCINADLSPGPGAGGIACSDLTSAYTSAGTLEVAIDTPVGTPGLPDGGLKQKLSAASVALDSHVPGQYGPDDKGGVLYGLTQIKLGIDAHAPGLYGPTDPGGLEYGLEKLIVGTDAHAPGTYGTADAGGLAYGLGAIGGGVQQLVQTVVATLLTSLGTPTSDPATTLRGAAAALNDGAGAVADGAGQLAVGAKQLEGGVGQLGAGLGQIKSGAGQLDEGAGQLSKGASDLSSGLNDAAVGSGQLADGLQTAADSAPQLEDGAQRLSDEGTKKLVEAGKSTAADYGEKYALIVAGAERAKSEGMAYGAPAGATGVTAYSLELAGENGEGGRNLGRGLGALALLGVGTAAAGLVRRRLA